MLKKYIALIFLCISNLILIGHDIIPHEHSDHSHDVELALQHESDHHHIHHHTVPSSDHRESHDQEDEHSLLGDLFANFVHTGSYFPESQNQSVHAKLLKQNPRIASLVAPIINTKEKSSFTINQRTNCWQDIPIYISPHNLSSGLRAPPVSLS